MKKVHSVPGRRDEELAVAMDTLGRFGFALQRFSGATGITQNLSPFVEGMLELFDEQSLDAWNVLEHALKGISEEGLSSGAKEKIHSFA